MIIPCSKFHQKPVACIKSEFICTQSAIRSSVTKNILLRNSKTISSPVCFCMPVRLVSLARIMSNTFSKVPRRVNSKHFQKKNPFSRDFSFRERVTGVEPVSLPWQGNIIAAIRYPPSSRQSETTAGRPASSPSWRTGFHFNIFPCRAPESNWVHVAPKSKSSICLRGKIFSLAFFPNNCLGRESNSLHKDFQSSALPMSYPGPGNCTGLYQ
jgi:hypothetical protein